MGNGFLDACGFCSPDFPWGAGKLGGCGAWPSASTCPSPALLGAGGGAEVPDFRVKYRREKERSERWVGARLEGSGAAPGASCPALPCLLPPSRCQVLRGGVGARGGDGWRLSSPGSRNASSARNGEATGGGGEALRLPQPPRCKRDFASQQRGLRARPPPRSPPSTSSVKTWPRP